MKIISNILLINIIFIALGAFYLKSDDLIPFWDLKVHIIRSYDLISAVKHWNLNNIFNIMASTRPPGTMIPLIPFFLILPLNLKILQFVYLLFYGNLFVIGTAKLGKELFPDYQVSWFWLLPALAPILWSLTLIPYYDIGPLALTPWLLYTALITERFQKIIPSILFGVVFAFEIIFRSYGAYICIAFMLSYGVYLSYYFVWNLIHKQISFKKGRKFVLCLGLAALTAVVLAYVPLTGIIKVLSKDIGNAAYLWNQHNSLFYLKHQLSILGTPIVIFAVFGMVILLTKNAFTRFMLLFYVITLYIFQFVIKNQDPRYIGVMAALCIFSACCFLGWIVKRIPRNGAITFQVLVAALFIHQLLTNLFIIDNPISKTIAGYVHYADSPVYANSGNQMQVIRDIFAELDKDKGTRHSIYVGKDRQDFNYEYLNWVQDQVLLKKPSEKHLIYYADVPRYHGIPEDFLDTDYILTGKTGTPFNKKLTYDGAKALLPNFVLAKKFPLATYKSNEDLELWKRIRPATLHESIQFQQYVLSLDPENLHAIEQLLWLYKVRMANSIRDGKNELEQVAQLVPASFAKSNIVFQKLIPLCSIPNYVAPGKADSLAKFCADHGTPVQRDMSFELSADEYNKTNSFEWFFMTKYDADWVPLVTWQRVENKKWTDRKWGSLLTDSLIGLDNKIVVKTTPVGVFWAAPEAGRYKFNVSVAAENNLEKGDVRFTVNNRDSSSNFSRNGWQKDKSYQAELLLNRGDETGLIFAGENSYMPSIEITRM